MKNQHIDVKHKIEAMLQQLRDEQKQIKLLEEQATTSIAKNAYHKRWAEIEYLVTTIERRLQERRVGLLLDKNLI